MKLISFFSKFAFICNLCFVVFVFFNRLEAKKEISGSKDTVVALPFFKDLIIILGFSAIVVNLVVCVVYLVNILMKTTFRIPKWIAIANFVFLIVQIYFFFL